MRVISREIWTTNVSSLYMSETLFLGPSDAEHTLGMDGDTVQLPVLNA